MYDMRSTEVCPNCGTAVYSNVCPYCGTNIAAYKGAEAAKYPVVKCKKAGPSFAMVFGFLFGGFWAGLHIKMIAYDKGFSDFTAVNYCLLLAGLAFVGYSLSEVIRWLLVLIKGEWIDGTVQGYENDPIRRYGNKRYKMPGQIAKILVYSEEGYKIIKLPMYSAMQPYPVNSEVRLKMFGKSAMIRAK